MFSIGPYTFPNKLFLAPMAGLTDHPFRQLCRSLGADLATSEMLTSDTRLWHTDKSKTRLPQLNETEPRIVQLTGNDPVKMAYAAEALQQKGAQIIDINMGCPVKKVCHAAAGSALLSQPKKVAQIIEAITQSIDIPVTLKIRTGSDEHNRNALEIASIAEKNNISALFIHGRTRVQKFSKFAEFETCRLLKQHFRNDLPIIANGDINNKNDAEFVLNYTQADGIMIGRGALGSPWIFNELKNVINPIDLQSKQSKNRLLLNQSSHSCNIYHALKQKLMIDSSTFSYEMKIKIILYHIQTIHDYYPPQRALALAKRHIGYYLEKLSTSTCLSVDTLPTIESKKMNEAQNRYHKAKVDTLQAKSCNHQRIAFSKALSLAKEISLFPIKPYKQVAKI